MLSKTLTHKIVEEVKKLIHEEIIIVDLTGIIIAGTELSRVGSFHEGALRCIEKRTKILITKDDEKRLKGVKAGLNLPIFFLNRVVGVIGITGEPEKTLPYGELLQKMTELLVQESYYIEETQWFTRRLESFVIDWIEGKELDEELRERAGVLKIELESSWQVILIQVRSKTDILLRGPWHLQQVWNELYESDIFIPWGQKCFLIVHKVKNDSEKTTVFQKVKELKHYIEKAYDSSVAAGIGQIVASQEISVGLEQAENALKVAMKTNGVISEDQLRLELCLSEIRETTRDEFRKRVLQNLDKQKDLIQTVVTLLEENMSLKSTAAKLHIHINTLHYRIKKVEEMTGLDLKSLPDVVSLYLAIVFLDEHTMKESE